MRRCLTYLCLTALLATLVACRNDEPPIIAESENPVILSVGQKPTRATIFEHDNMLIDHAVGGGNYTLDSYVTGTTTQYHNDNWVYYFPDGARWWFRTGNVMYNTYWPKTKKLDFMAYMPYSEQLSKSTFEIEPYQPATGASFSCALPLVYNGTTPPAGVVTQDNVQEFLYAYTKNKGYDDQVAAGGAVHLQFVHPTAAIYLKLAQSYRMILESISFENIYNQGTYSSTDDTSDGAFDYGTWSYQGDKTGNDLVLNFNKKVPEDINYNSVFVGPILVLPQALDNVILDIKAQRTDGTTYNKALNFNTVDAAYRKWEPGKKYTYTLQLDDNNEEILFKIEVEAWTAINHDHIVDVE
ncbi:MAG: fimbrillin family protein [Bacteroidaceae bacterium]|nr:fimbrillin family protein [Bacteroidaceae bacterium]